MSATSRLAVLAVLVVACGQKRESPGAGSAKPEAPEWTAHVALPVVDGYKAPAPPDEAVLVVTPTGIVFDGVAILQLTAGRPDPSEIDGGTFGVKLPRLTSFLAAYLTKHGIGALPLAFDKAVPYRTFFSVVYSAKQKETGLAHFALLAKTAHGALAEAPFTLPERAPSGIATPEPTRPGADLAKQVEDVRNAGRAVKVGDEKAKDNELSGAARPDDPPTATIRVSGDPPRPDRPVQLVVAIGKTDVILWSFSGLEGTINAPKLQVPLDGAAAPLRKALEEIVALRWSGKERNEHTILIMADGDTPMGRVEEIVGAARADAAGKPLFPDLTFSAGFE
jgi:hypothetical protein